LAECIEGLFIVLTGGNFRHAPDNLGGF